MKELQRIKQLKEALAPFAAIAYEYDADGLDEARRGVDQYDGGKELYSRRGGKQLITLEQVMVARDALTGRVHPRPSIDIEITTIRQLYEASCPNLAWEKMSGERRDSIIKNYRQVLKGQ